MSKLNELIAQLCPEGVVFSPLVSVADVLYGFPCDASLFNTDGMGMPLARIRDVLAGKTDTYTIEQVPERYILSRGDLLVGMDGNFHVANWKTDGGILCQRVCKIYSKDEAILLNGFLSHLLKPIMKRLEDNKQGGTVKHLLDKDIKAITIPVPPVPVQSEIVRILDNFTELTAGLTAELEAETIARGKQYEYYRERLLTHNSNVPVLPLRSVVKHSCSGTTPIKSNAAFYEGGTIPWIRTQDVKFNEIHSVEGRITEEAVKKTAAKWIPENCVIVAISGATAGRCAVNKIKATTNQHCLNLEINPELALYRYVYHCVCHKYQELLAKKQGARGDLNSTLILDTEIPIPPLAVQEDIVRILDSFDAICTDLSKGLPAEIEARQKQYEFYRDKLLTFKEYPA